MCERNVDGLPLTQDPNGDRPATQACAQTRNQTSDASLVRTTLNQLSHTGQGYLTICKSQLCGKNTEMNLKMYLTVIIIVQTILRHLNYLYWFISYRIFSLIPQERFLGLVNILSLKVLS